MWQGILYMWQVKWNIVNDQSKTNYDIGNKSLLLQQCCILVRGEITAVAAGADGINQVALKNCVQFITCITKLMEQR